MTNTNLPTSSAIESTTNARSSAQDKRAFLSIEELKQRTGLGRSTLYSKMKRGSPYFDSDFPNSIQISGNRVAWIESEFEAWQNAKIEATRRRKH